MAVNNIVLFVTDSVPGQNEIHDNTSKKIAMNWKEKVMFLIFNFKSNFSNDFMRKSKLNLS